MGNLEFPNYKNKKPTHFISPTGHTCLDIHHSGLSLFLPATPVTHVVLRTPVPQEVWGEALDGPPRSVSDEHQGQTPGPSVIYTAMSRLGLSCRGPTRHTENSRKPVFSLWAYPSDAHTGAWRAPCKELRGNVQLVISRAVCCTAMDQR